MTHENIVTGRKPTERAADILKYKIEKLPVVDENNRLIGLIIYKDNQGQDRNACMIVWAGSGCCCREHTIH
jgi:IMP dehydrogenase